MSQPKLIYGKKPSNMHITMDNRAILTNMNNHKVINRGERDKFMNVMKKIFIVNLQKDDLLRVFEGQNMISKNNTFQEIVSRINSQIRNAKSTENKNIRTILNEMMQNKEFIPPNGLNQKMFTSILLLYVVLYDLVHFVKEKLNEYNNQNTTIETKNTIYRSLRYLAKKYILLREKIYQFFIQE